MRRFRVYVLQSPTQPRTRTRRTHLHLARASAGIETGRKCISPRFYEEEATPLVLILESDRSNVRPRTTLPTGPHESRYNRSANLEIIDDGQGTFAVLSVTEY